MVEICGFSNIGKRSAQQDRYGFFPQGEITDHPDCTVAFLADGIGGFSDGAVASEAICETLQICVNEMDMEADPVQFVLETIDRCQASVKQKIFQNNMEPTGSTLVLLLVIKNQMYFGSVGDSRIYLNRAGKLIMLNREHNYYRRLAVAASKGSISWEEANNQPMKKFLTQYIGMDMIGEPDYLMEPIELMAGDELLLMSDGVYGSITAKDMEDILKDHDIGVAAKLMEQKVLQIGRDDQDNFTCVIMKINE